MTQSISGASREPVVLTHASGSRAELFPQGAHVARWLDASGDEILFLSREARFEEGASIRGGIPVIFPQFADRGPLPKHGFARTAVWNVVEAEGASARLRLDDSPATRALWPHSFRAELSVRLEADALEMELAIQNTGTDPFTFTAALHSYFRVEDVRRVTVEGLAGVRYVDKVADGAEREETSAGLSIDGETDRVYLDAPDLLRIADAVGGRVIEIHKRGFADAVVWNPWEDGAAALPDFADDEYLGMVCVEAAQVGRPVSLEPGERWKGGQRLNIRR